MPNTPRYRAELISASPGRARLRVPNIKRDEEKARDVEIAFSQLEGVSQVSANPLTASVLLLFDAQNTNQDAILSAAEEAGLLDLTGYAEEEHDPPTDTDAEETSPVPSLKNARSARDISRAYGRLVKDGVNTLNDKVSAATGQTLDLPTIVPTVMFALAIRDLITRRVPVPWYTMMWYSISVFRDLNLKEKVVVEKKTVADASAARASAQEPTLPFDSPIEDEAVEEAVEKAAREQVVRHSYEAASD